MKCSYCPKDIPESGMLWHVSFRHRGEYSKVQAWLDASVQPKLDNALKLAREGMKGYDASADA